MDVFERQVRELQASFDKLQAAYEARKCGGSAQAFHDAFRGLPLPEDPLAQGP